LRTHFWEKYVNRKENIVGFEVLTAVVMKSTIFWVITPCSPVKVNRRFGGTYRLLAACFHSVFLLDLFFDPEEGGDKFLQNVC
jgi:hypothetical protein